MSKQWHIEQAKKYYTRALHDRVRGYDNRAEDNLERARRHLQETMTDGVLTAGDLKQILEGVPDDETVCVVRGGALGEATDAYRNVEGVVIEGR